MTGARTVTMRIIGAQARTVEAVGPGVVRALDDLRCPRQPRPGGVWLAPAQFADELEARLTAAGYVVEWAI